MGDRPTYAATAPPIIKVPVEVDTTNCAKVASELTAACVPGVRTVIADLTQTTFCDSSALRVLLQAHRVAETQGIDFAVAVNSHSVLRVLEITGLTSILRLYPSVPAALDAWRRDPA